MHVDLGGWIMLTIVLGQTGLGGMDWIYLVEDRDCGRPF
jgi:hypothetical protein